MNKTFKSFQDFIAYIDENYHFTPVAFKNGNHFNQAGENNGSCKVFAYAKQEQLSQKDTLELFGQYYQDVQNTPEGTDHQNIRNFMIFGWDGIQFERVALVKK